MNFDDLPDDVRIETRITLTVARSLPFLRDVMKSLMEKKKVAALVVDLFGTDAFDVANELKISPYIFFPSTAMCLSLFLYLPQLDQMVSCEFKDLPEVRIPGCVPIPGKDILDPIQDRKNDAYKYTLHNAKRYRMAEGIIVNSFPDLEQGPLKALQQKRPLVYPIGPVIQNKPSSSPTNNEADRHECLKWLDDQPRGSVLFISFGSGGSLSHEQLIELALGLELSEQRFLWVVRCPNDSVANATYFNVAMQNDPIAYMPQGFLERTKGRSFMVPFWAPQAQVLAHESIGGFLTHCGWNSILETVVNGVPLIAWPLYAEQHMNAIMLAEDLKVALRPKVKENGVVGRVEIANVAKELMEGEEGKRLRSRMRNLKDAAARVLSEGGSSTKAMADLTSTWRKKISA